MNNVPDTRLRGHIAIVGMAGRFPGAKNIDEFWRNLCDGVEAIATFTTEEVIEAGVDPGTARASNYVKARGFLAGSDLFDAHFFGFTPREAEVMDPQHRVFFECAWECLEHAGYDPQRYDGRISVYAGSSVNSYAVDLANDPEIVESASDLQRSIGTRRDHLTTRVSYKLNLRGPSIDIQTACSTSLVAVHFACQSLLNHESDMALAGGVCVRTPEKRGYLYYEGGIHSPDGHCRAFDAKAAGTVGGSGVGLVLLKRLSDARRDNDSVYAVIRGSAINNDGGMKVGYTAPSATGQAQVIAEAQALAQIAPQTITYVEAHGTGTRLGDPIEVSALGEVFPRREDETPYCVLGAVKTNVGHLDTAAGITGLIKTTLSLYHKKIPPTLHFQQPNPHTNLESSPFRVNNQIMNWDANGTPRRAGVSAFGIGGTNAHVVMEECFAPDRAPDVKRPRLFILSGKTASALEKLSDNLALFLRQHTDRSLSDIAYTLQVGRQAFDHRRILVADDAIATASVLETLRPGQVYTSSHKPATRPVVFMFPGQGTQYPDVARALYEHESAFRSEVDRCTELFRSILDFDIKSILYPPPEEKQQALNRMRNTLVAQPVVFTISYALAKLWTDWGVRPAAMIGHSLGEYVAACLCGVISLEDAIALVAARAQLMSALPEGAMVIVPLHEDETVTMLSPRLSVAASNGPSLQVVSGSRSDIDQFVKQLEARQIESRYLSVSHAFHSPMMEPILSTFTKRVRQMDLAPPKIPYISNVTGTWITEAEATSPEYFSTHLRSTVRFGDGLSQLFATPDAILLEVGPGKSLTAMAKTHPQKGRAQTILSSLHNSTDAVAEFAGVLETLGRLWLTGVDVNWNNIQRGQQRRRVALPPYPFERQRYMCRPQWHSPKQVSFRKDTNLSEWFYVPLWQQSVGPARLPIGMGQPATLQREYLIFVDRCGVGATVREMLEKAGQSVTTVEAASQFRRVADNTVTINPAQPEDYDLLCQDLVNRNKQPAIILNFWNVTADEESQPGLETSERCQVLSFYSLVYFAQALAKHAAQNPTKLIVFSSNVHRVMGDETIRAEKAMILGPCRVIPQEYPFIVCRNVDIVIPNTQSAHERLIRQVLRECAAESSESVVAYRASHRWAQYFSKLSLEPALSPRLRDRGVYLITGGLGGIGLVIAEYLARKARARLILIGRSDFPAPQDWDNWIVEHDETDPIADKIRTLQKLRSLGAELFLATADVANEEQMRRAVLNATGRFGQVNGVIHAAGIAGGGLIELKNPDSLASVLRPKVRGTRVLESVLDIDSLDFFILCSSLGAFFGRLGQVDYCAANAFLDAYAHSQAAAEKASVLSVNWCAWSEVGMLRKQADQSGVVRPPESYSTKPTNHPLLGSCLVDAPDRKTYVVQLSVKDHWVLDDHRIGGTAVLPGTSYLEIARAACESLAGDCNIELRDVFFLVPVAVRDDETRLVHVTLERQTDVWRFRITAPLSAAEEESHTEVAVGSVAFVPRTIIKHHDIAQLRNSCTAREVTPGDDLTLRFSDLGPRWHSLRKVHVGDHEVFSRLALPDEFVSDLETFKLHPALLDRAIGTSKHFLVQESNYLPFSYKKLTIHKPLPPNVYVHAKYKSGDHMTGETITCDVTFIDTDGTEIVSIEGFTQKRVANVAKAVDELIRRPTSASQPQEHRSTNILERNLAGGMTSNEGTEVFDHIISSAFPAQIIISTVDFDAALAEARAPRMSQPAQDRNNSQEKSDAPLMSDSQSESERTTGQSLEEVLVAIWQDVLGLDKVSVNDNFLELGGDSVQAMQIIARATRIGLKCTVRQIFRHLTIAELVEVLEWNTEDQSRGGTMVELPPVKTT